MTYYDPDSETEFPSLAEYERREEEEMNYAMALEDNARDMSAAPTRVVNKTREPFDVDIGRPGKWGNPFLIGRDGTRAQVIDKYEAWLREQYDLLDALGELRGKVLGCYCKPLACHGDLLAYYADNPDVYFGPVV